jgi:hypothetical protein
MTLVFFRELDELVGSMALLGDSDLARLYLTIIDIEMGKA